MHNKEAECGMLVSFSFGRLLSTQMALQSEVLFYQNGIA